MHIDKFDKLMSWGENLCTKKMSEKLFDELFIKMLMKNKDSRQILVLYLLEFGSF